MRGIFITSLLALSLCSCTMLNYLPARLGEMSFDRGDYASAIAFYRRAIAGEDRRGETFYWLGMSYYRHGDLEEAMLSFEKCLEKDSTDIDALSRLGAVNLELGNLERAGWYCRRAIGGDAANLEPYNTLGHVLCELGELDSATSCFKHVLTTASTMRWQSIAQKTFAAYTGEKAEADNGLGEICISKAMFQQALEFFTSANALEPDWETPWFNKGRAYEALGNTRAAEITYRRTIDIAPRKTLAYKNLARMYRRMGKDEEAMHTYAGAILADSSDAVCYYELAQLYEEKGDNWTAADVYSHAVEKDPANPAYLRATARTSMATGAYDRAADLLSALVQLQPDLAEPYNALGEALTAAGDTIGAMRCFEEAVETDSSYSAPLRNAGKLLLKQSEESKGVDYLLRAARLGDAPAADILRSRNIRWE
jgi:tetratricopeptide (TPR) repeat protein